MGQEASVFCSPTQPNGYRERRLDFPEMAMCSGQAVAHVVGDLAQDVQKRMPLATPESLQDDRINAWSNDLGDHAECSSTLQVLSCGGTTRAPMNYLADMQTKGAIMLDSREGPVLMDDDGEDQVVSMDPGEVNLPRAAKKDRALMEPFHSRRKDGKSLQVPSGLDGRGKFVGLAK